MQVEAVEGVEEVEEEELCEELEDELDDELDDPRQQEVYCGSPHDDWPPALALLDQFACRQAGRRVDRERFNQAGILIQVLGRAALPIHEVGVAKTTVVAVGTALAGRPPHRSVREELPRTAPPLGIGDRDSRRQALPVARRARRCLP